MAETYLAMANVSTKKYKPIRKGEKIPKGMYKMLSKTLQKSFKLIETTVDEGEKSENTNS